MVGPVWLQAVVDGHDFMLRLLDQHVQPLAHVRRQHVHQTEAGDERVPGEPVVLPAHDDELHLDHAQQHPGGGQQGDQEIATPIVRCREGWAPHGVLIGSVC